MASLPCFRLPGGVGLDGGSPWGPQFLAGTLLYTLGPALRKQDFRACQVSYRSGQLMGVFLAARGVFS